METIVKTMALLLVIACVFVTLSANQQVQHLAASQTTSAGPPVTLHVTVTDRNGGFVAGLKASNFEISIDKKLTRIVSAESADSPVSIGIVFDASGSMVGRSEKKTARALVALREALRQFMESGNPLNQYFLIAFNRKPQLLSDWTSEPGTIVERFSGINVYNRTTMYDAVYLAVNKLQGGHHSKRALILISDGMDNASEYTFIQLRDSLRETDVLLYAMDLPTKDDMSSIGVEGHGILDELSSISGGRAFLTKARDSRKERDVELAFETIKNELRSQYTIAVVSPEPNLKKKLFKVKIKVNPSAGTTGLLKDLKVRSREGFFF